MSQPSATTTTTPSKQQLPSMPTLPPRELALLEDLQNPSLQWLSTKGEEHNAWESDGTSNPYRRGSAPNAPEAPNAPRPYSPLCKLDLNDVTLSPSAHRHTDWHTIDRETLSVTTDAHTINFSQTRSDSYSHHTRQRRSTISYTLTFIDREDTGRRTTLSGSEHLQLAELFKAISDRIN